jgi:site-specific recombinase XerD
MPENVKYPERRAKEVTLLTREILKELPSVCFDFIRSLEPITQPLTRYVYACDLKLFFHFLFTELPAFSARPVTAWTSDEFNRLTARDIHLYLEYLDYYIKDDSEHSNAELGKMRKLSSLRSFFHFLFKSERINTDITLLVDLPKRHTKPILRMEIDEVARMLDYVETGEAMAERQRTYNEHTRQRDLTILTMFLGTGIRVSELVGIDIEDIDFSINGFLVTRKGGNQVVLYFPDEVADVLKSYLASRMEIEALPGHEHALFLSLQKKRMSVRAVEIMVKKYATQAAPLKKRLSPHKLRSTFGTNLYHETGDIYLVAEVLGHTDVNTTRRHYAAISDDRRRMAAQHVKLREDAPVAAQEETSSEEAAPVEDQEP